MKVIIFGATGTIGKVLVKQLLEKGYGVTAFVRSPEKLQSLMEDKLHIYKGDVKNLNDVEQSISGHDTVICVLGDGNLGTIRAIGTQNIITAMKNGGLRRLICQSTLGMGESYQNLNILWKYVMFGMLLKKAFKDHQLQEQYVLASGLDYTIVRPSALVDGGITHKYKVGFDGKHKKLSLKISRADVADFIIEHIQNKEYIQKAVSISN